MINPWYIVMAVVMFLGISFVVQNNLEAPQTFVEHSKWGMALYLLISTLLVIIPFASPMAWIPVASILWGWPVAGVLTLIGWVTASQIVFEVSRRLGRQLIVRAISTKRLHQASAFLKKGGVFGMIAIRILLPADVSSCTLALFTKVGRLHFFIVSVASLAGPAFLYSYVGSLSVELQAFIIGCVILVGVLVFLSRKQIWHLQANNAS